MLCYAWVSESSLSFWECAKRKTFDYFVFVSFFIMTDNFVSSIVSLTDIYGIIPWKWGFFTFFYMIYIKKKLLPFKVFLFCLLTILLCRLEEHLFPVLSILVFSYGIFLLHIKILFCVQTKKNLRLLFTHMHTFFLILLHCNRLFFFCLKYIIRF